jgi:hypothetical protein
LLIILTGNPADAANSFNISLVLSVEQSSQITSSSGNLVCCCILANWRLRNRSPLYVQRATEIFCWEWLMAELILSVSSTPERNDGETSMTVFPAFPQSPNKLSSCLCPLALKTS